MKVRSAIVWCAAALLGGALAVRFHQLGGPYFSAPRTLYDHVTATGHETAYAILVARRAAPLLPRGATVAMLRPSLPDDTTYFHTAVGLLPYQRVVSRTRAPQFILTVHEMLDDPDYRLVAEFPEGKLYTRR